MKLRVGFVSNSSSSSFVALLSLEDYNKIRDSLSVTEAATVDVIGAQSTKFLGKDCVSFGYVSGNYSTLEYIDKNTILEQAKVVAKERNETPPDELDQDDIWEAPCSMQDAIMKLDKDSRFTHTEDF